MGTYHHPCWPPARAASPRPHAASAGVNPPRTVLVHRYRPRRRESTAGLPPPTENSVVTKEPTARPSRFLLGSRNMADRPGVASPPQVLAAQRRARREHREHRRGGHPGSARGNRPGRPAPARPGRARASRVPAQGLVRPWWITEMGSSPDSHTASQHVARGPCFRGSRQQRPACRHPGTHRAMVQPRTTSTGKPGISQDSRLQVLELLARI